MKSRYLIYFFISLLFLIPSTSIAGDFFIIGDGDFTIADTDTTNFQLFSFYDLRERDSFVQVTNTGGAATLHVQVFDVSNLCNENNFNDTYTPNDTHVYNMKDIQTNDGSPSGVQLPDGTYGFVVVTVVQGNGQPADTNGVIIGNFRVTDNAGYEYRSNSQGFKEGDPIGGQYFINYTSAGGINRSDIVGITVNNLLSGEVTTAGSSVTFDTSIFNNDEVIFSCSDTTFSCTENTFEYGINEAIPHSRDKSVLCESNNIPEGMVKLETIDDTETEAFAGFVGINTGDNSRGSMDSVVAVRTQLCGDGILDTSQGEECDDGNNVDGDGCQANCLNPICGDSIVDLGEGETCDPPFVPQPPSGNDCRDDCTFCGDGILDPGEACDDGNSTPGDGCENDCTITPTTGDSDCCIANGSPGCTDMACETIICTQDQFCCDVTWDQICADQAIADPTCLPGCAP